MLKPIDIFLKRNNLYNNFISAIKESMLSNSYEDAVDFYNKFKNINTVEEQLVSAMFIWGSTSKGIGYWFNVETDYIRFLKKLRQYQYKEDNG